MRGLMHVPLLLFAAFLLAGCSGATVRTVGLSDEYIFNGPASWSPDGSELLLISSTLRQPFNHTPESEYAVYTISPEDSSALRHLTNRLSTSTGRYYPDCWLPDDNSLVAVYEEGGVRLDDPLPRLSVVLLNADGEYLSTIVEPTEASIGGLSCSPDGQRVVFVREDAETYRLSMMMVNTDGTDEHEVVLRVENYRGPIIALSSYSTPAWSPDGEWIAFAHYQDIYIVRSDGSDGVNLTQTPYIHEEWPTWSPDGRRIAFVVINAEVLPDAGWVYVINRDGSGREQVTFDDRTYAGLLWSPDGRWIAAAEALGSINGVSQSSSAAVLIPVGP